ncbi:MAG: ACP S-malonyltransferase [Deltaproteobacteria bacterium]|nr:ACP S-malonyltransferase [Deltaproteobacteria bacterium]
MGMGHALSQRFPEFEAIFKETLREADASIGFSLSQIIETGPAEKLKETEITQPALLTVSTAMARWLKGKGIRATLAIGHSLGEYSALVFSGALSFQDAVKLVQLRGRLMQNAVPLGEGGMAALIGANLETAEKICLEISKSLGAVLEPSVLNNPGQVVVSGHARAIEEAVKRGKEFGLRMVMPLEVSGPFHCSLLKSAGEALKPALFETKWHKPEVNVLSNVTAKPETESAEIVDNLVKQVYQTVRFESCLKFAEAQGCKNFVEVGSGKVLTGILKKTLPDAKCVALESLEKLEDLHS